MRFVPVRGARAIHSTIHSVRSALPVRVLLGYCLLAVVVAKSPAATDEQSLRVVSPHSDCHSSMDVHHHDHSGTFSCVANFPVVL